MKTLRVNDYDLAYIELGAGPPLVMIHGSLGDFRSWSSVLGPLSRKHRLVIPSLRRFFPEHWDGKGGGFTIAQHTADVIAFIEAMNVGPVHLMGHSRGGHIAFRVAEQRPELIRRLILAEPGGELADDLRPPGQAPSTARVSSVVEAAEMIMAGDVEGGLGPFVDRIVGPGAWAKLPAATKQLCRDNAYTLVGQINEQRQPFTRSGAESIRSPTLLIGGERSTGAAPIVLRALAGAIPGARSAFIPDATHVMFEQAPIRFSEIVLEFVSA